MTYFPPRTLERSTSILGALHRAKTGMTLHELGEATGMDHSTLRNELDRMLASNQVEREPIAEGSLLRIQSKSGHYRYRFTEEFGKLVMDLG